MKIEHGFTTSDQSLKMRDLGFTSDTASFIEYQYTDILGDEKTTYIPKCMCLDNAIIEVTCVWSIGDMIEMLPKGISDKNAYPYIDSGGVSYSYWNYDDFKDIRGFFICDLLRDNLFNCLIWLKENKYL